VNIIGKTRGLIKATRYTSCLHSTPIKWSSKERLEVEGGWYAVDIVNPLFFLYLLTNIYNHENYN